MGYTATYDEATDFITIKDGDTILRHGPAMDFAAMINHEALLEELFPDQEVPTDPKALRAAVTPKNSKIELKVSRDLIIVNGLYTSGTFADARFRASSGGTLDDLAKVLQSGQEEFLASSDCKSLAAALERVKKDDTVKITNVMILGTGSMDRPFIDRELHTEQEMEIFNERGFFEPGRVRQQLAVAIQISEILGEPGLPLPITAQEPDYSELEKEYLRTRHNFTVVDDPDAFSLINKNTLVFLVAIPHDARYWISQGTWPAAMIGSSPPTKTLARFYTKEICDAVLKMWGFYDPFNISNRLDGREGKPTWEIEMAHRSNFIAWNYHDFLWVNRQGQREWIPCKDSD